MEEIQLPTREIVERVPALKRLEGVVPAQIAENLAALTTDYTPDPGQELKEPSYYDYPVLKAPVWR